MIDACPASSFHRPIQNSNTMNRISIDTTEAINVLAYSARVTYETSINHHQPHKEWRFWMGDAVFRQPHQKQKAHLIGSRQTETCRKWCRDWIEFLSHQPRTARQTSKIDYVTRTHQQDLLSLRIWDPQCVCECDVMRWWHTGIRKLSINENVYISFVYRVCRLCISRWLPLCDISIRYMRNTKTRTRWAKHGAAAVHACGISVEWRRF